MKNIVIVGIAMLLIGAIAGAGIAWEYRQSEIDDAFQEGISYQQSVGEVAAGTPASVTLEGISTFDQEDEVTADGGVDSASADSGTLYVNNTEDTDGRNAENTYLTLWNPVTGSEGLHDNLETDYTEIYVQIQGKTTYIYSDGEYIGENSNSPGVSLGTLSPKERIEITVYVKLDESVAGTFQDAESTTNYLYLYQPNADYCDVISFTITT